MRREIRVKAGYKPPEDVEVYKNKTAETWKNRGKGGVPGAEAVGGEEKLPPHKIAANKGAKRREARKKAAAAATRDGGNDDGRTEDADIKANGVEEHTRENDAESKPELVDPDAEKAKEARKLSKKLRQARELQEKKANGDNLLPEQVEKVIKINEMIRQLSSLGFNVNGEKLNQPNGDIAAD